MIVLLEIHKTELDQFVPVFRGLVNFFGVAVNVFVPLNHSYWWEPVGENQSLPKGLREMLGGFAGRKYKSVQILRSTSGLVEDDDTEEVITPTITTPIFALIEF